MEAQTQARDLELTDRLSRSPIRGARNQNANARVSRKELDQLKQAASSEGKALGEWTREVLLRAAGRGAQERAIFTELIALRLLMNGVLRELAVGRNFTEQQYQALVTEVRSSKHETARDVLTQYQPSIAGGQ